jgi:hypothetical protein
MMAILGLSFRRIASITLVSEPARSQRNLVVFLVSRVKLKKGAHHIGDLIFILPGYGPDSIAGGSDIGPELRKQDL